MRTTGLGPYENMAPQNETSSQDGIQSVLSRVELSITSLNMNSRLLLLQTKLQTAFSYYRNLCFQNSETGVVHVDPNLFPYSIEWEVSLVECLLCAEYFNELSDLILITILEMGSCLFLGRPMPREIKKKIPKITKWVNKLKDPGFESGF